MTIDWLIAKLKRKKYFCFNCSKYISNECRNLIDSNSNVYSKCGGWCVPYNNQHYYIATNQNNLFCINFKHKRNFK